MSPDDEDLTVWIENSLLILLDQQKKSAPQPGDVFMFVLPSEHFKQITGVKDQSEAQQMYAYLDENKQVLFEVMLYFTQGSHQNNQAIIAHLRDEPKGTMIYAKATRDVSHLAKAS